ncbi:hypothetical protein EDB92DRAFT_1935436 [Lactarius akahatsu]|uniref:C2H2-type domain-containing protein n=1 Tax=Lactarius akahatsu TaxID=416441 RepID=A0AAD4LFQ6_9AGAM|nr:hypothetical protein EDB92DRAFT_1935436 [Lactarius akahatsu]
MSPIKRQHTPSPSRTSSPAGTPKALRVSAPIRSPLLCTLPPTCNPPNRPTPLSDTRALEAHYAAYHAHVCSSPGCGCVFPDAHLFELHLTECHDPLAALHRERGDKIFACHLSSCPRVFANPKARRLHLISVHAYPKEYFFAITNKGIGGLLRRWGEGASLLRGQWRPRDNNDEDEDEDDGASLPPSSTLHSDDSDGPDDDHNDAEGGRQAKANGGDDAVDALAQDVSALGLVPSSVRFGRGGSSRASEGNDNDKGAEDSDAMEQDGVVASDKPPSVRGRRGRGRAGGGGGAGVGRGSGRGRGGFVPPPPRAGFLARGGAGHSRGLPRGLIATAIRGRGRGALI